jgi:hypothetical protein
MKKKKQHNEEPPKEQELDTELLRMYLMGATNPGLTTRIEKADEFIDLHIEKFEKGRSPIAGHDALFIQLEKFELALDRAIAAGNLEFRVVHGLGTGKLKKEIYKILDKHPHVRSYSNDYHSRYGYGSTLIYLQ